MKRATFLLPGLAFLIFSGCAFEDYEVIKIDEITNKQVIEGITPEMREAAAYEVAMQTKNGTAPNLPLLYWSKFTYITSIEGGCWGVVTEKNLQRETTNTFRFDLCPDEN